MALTLLCVFADSSILSCSLTTPSTAEIYVEERNKFRGATVGVVAIEQATLDRERNVALAKWSEGIVACNVKENIKNSL